MGMDVKVNKSHRSTLIEDSGEKPILPEVAKLIDTGAGVPCVYTKEKTHCFFVPPLRRFSPPVKNLQDSIETPSPYEGSYHGILVLMDSDWFTDEP